MIAPEDIDGPTAQYEVKLGHWNVKVEAVSPLDAMTQARKHFQREWPMFYYDISVKNWADYKVELLNGT